MESMAARDGGDTWIKVGGKAGFLFVNLTEVWVEGDGAYRVLQHSYTTGFRNNCSNIVFFFLFSVRKYTKSYIGWLCLPPTRHSTGRKRR